MSTHVMSLWETWREPLVDLARRLRDIARASLVDADAAGRLELASIANRGAGDWTFGIDLAPEREIARWHTERARSAPLSVLTEDEGWRHLGPGPVTNFPAGAPRLVFDPIDGTRPLMTGLGSAWVSIALATGDGPPTMDDVIAGVLVEIPPLGRSDSAALVAGPAGPALQAHQRLGEAPGVWRELTVDDDARVDHGFFPLVRYHPLQRLALARREEAFWRRVAELEGASLDVVWDDQVVCNVAQLVSVARGHYRACIDARALLNEHERTSFPTSKPYDVAAALHVARAAGVALEGADGGRLDFPLDATTPIHFAAYHNAPTRARLAPHWLAALDETR
ncbi:MAG: hypothetical protein WD226_08880 [Planctomycetota bacterium]